MQACHIASITNLYLQASSCSSDNYGGHYLPFRHIATLPCKHLILLQLHSVYLQASSGGSNSISRCQITACQSMATLPRKHVILLQLDPVQSLASSISSSSSSGSNDIDQLPVRCSAKRRSFQVLRHQPTPALHAMNDILSTPCCMFAGKQQQQQ